MCRSKNIIHDAKNIIVIRNDSTNVLLELRNKNKVELKQDIALNDWEGGGERDVYMARERRR